jgi:hypothetical protein
VSVWNQADFFEAGKPARGLNLRLCNNDNNMPTYWLKSMESIMAVVSSGKFFKKRIWLALFEDGVSTKARKYQQIGFSDQ